MSKITTPQERDALIKKQLETDQDIYTAAMILIILMGGIAIGIGIAWLEYYNLIT